MQAAALLEPSLRPIRGNLPAWSNTVREGSIITLYESRPGH